MAVIEINRFSLADGTSTTDFLRVEADAQSRFYYQQAGLLRRTTAKGEGRSWVDIMLWSSPSHAAAAQQAATTSPAVAALEALIDPGSVVRETFETIE